MAVQGSQALCLPRFNLLDGRTGFSSAALVTQTNGICPIIVQTKNSTKPTALWREHNFGVAGQTVQYLLKLRASHSKKDVERNTITHHLGPDCCVPNVHQQTVRTKVFFFLWPAPLSFDWSPHLRLTCGPGNRTTTESLSAALPTTPQGRLVRTKLFELFIGVANDPLSAALRKRRTKYRLRLRRYHFCLKWLVIV